jgi:hypothetical protein
MAGEQVLVELASILQVEGHTRAKIAPVDVGFGRVVVSETEAPNILVNPVHV